MEKANILELLRLSRTQLEKSRKVAANAPPVVPLSNHYRFSTGLNVDHGTSNDHDDRTLCVDDQAFQQWLS